MLHIECGKHTAADVVAKAQAVNSSSDGDKRSAVRNESPHAELNR